ncbi:MAG: toxin-activating lysine-acyltransferase [Phaeospirillum sp.]|nr:toxin-activating lysine-acyltransferase [Phaeospirillum sp.]
MSRKNAQAKVETSSGSAAVANQDVPESPAIAATEPSRPQAGPSSIQAQVFADVVALMAASPPHKHLFLTDLEWLVMPPLVLGQCSLVRREGRPFAFVSWAFLGPEAAARMTQPQLRLRPGDWKSGDEAWIIDVVAPFGGGEVALKEVKARTFADRKVKALQPAPDGKGLAVVEW